MKITRSNPPTVHAPTIYTHAVGARDATIYYLAGQVAWDKERNVVGAGDLATQTRQAFGNLAAILAHLGADFSHVLKMTMFVVDYSVEKRQVIADAALEFVERDNLPANTLVGVQALAVPELLIEIEAVVAVPHSPASTHTDDWV